MQSFLPKNATDKPPKWLLIGIGGGGDVYGCLPLKWELEQLGIEVHLGSLTWERRVVDPLSIPRRVATMEHVEVIADYGAIGGPDTCLEGFCFQGARLSAKLGGERVLFLDINGGPTGTRDAIHAYCERFGITGVVGVDVGGDSLSTATEPGLESPLADATMLAAIGQLDEQYPALLGIFGMNGDGELTQGELISRFSVLAPAAYVGAFGHGPQAFAKLEEVLADPDCITEASRMPLLALGGETGTQHIRKKHRHVELNLLLTITFLFDARKTLPLCPIASLIQNETDIGEVDHLIRDTFGIKTEYNPR
ncbi:MAG TPA: DUF1152 domain-containing protein [Candidatus Lokiarchaeia archaeon]|nr:DUF1152 domain-containing protein [Candidatus Lokiarchaeia archaeon]